VDRGTLCGSGQEGPPPFRLDNGGWRRYVDRHSTGGGVYTATGFDPNTWSG
jgi:hypothetical protein